MSSPISISIWIKTFPGLVLAAGVFCIWLGFTYSHALAGIFGGVLIVASILLFIHVFEQQQELRKEYLRYYY